MVLKQDGSVWATGWNEFGQLGYGSNVDQMNYVQVVSSGVKALDAGSRHSMVLKDDGSVWTAGYNVYGQLGDGWTTNSYVFAQVVPSGAVAVAAGGVHSMLVKKDGSIWAAGSNKFGQLGDGLRTPGKAFYKLATFDDGKGQKMIIYAQIRLHDPTIAGGCNTCHMFHKPLVLLIT